MGGVSFDTYFPLSDPKKAFFQAKEQALYDYGHAGYTGTIAEKPGFEIRKKEPMTQDEARDFIYGTHSEEGDCEENDKWGDAYAVPICAEKGGPIIGWIFYGWASS